VAWIALLPCAALVVLAILLLGPPLGQIMFPRSDVAFLPSVAQELAPRPEPTEQARFLLALTGPLLLTACVVLGVRHAKPLAPTTIARLVGASQLVALVFVAVCFVVQHRYRFTRLDVPVPSLHTWYFSLATLASAGAIAVAIAAVLGTERLRRRIASALLADSRPRRIAGTALALVAIVISLLPAINFEHTIVRAHDLIVIHFPFWLDETFAALDGRYPLVDFAAQYGSLWIYPIAGSMAVLGSSIGVFTVTMSVIGGAAMVAVFASLRRVARSTSVGLLLFLPFLATSFFMMEGPLDNRYAISNLFGTFPLRYAGPFLLLWLVARQLDGASPRRARWLFLAAGVVILNNVEFGLPALGATVAALLWSCERLTARRLRRLAVEAMIGLLGALIVVSLLTLVVAHSLPHLGLLVRYSRLFALSGFGLLPMVPTIGISTVLYLTYLGAIGAASVRAVERAPDRLLTGLLAWSGVFGLGIGSYYMGRSHPQVLTNMFAAWALSVTLLFLLAIRGLGARARRRPTIPELACLFAFGITVCSLAQLPTPWAQVERLRRTGVAIYRHPAGEAFIRLHTRRGEAVAILPRLGHRIAYNLGIVDVVPYGDGRSLLTFDQYDEMLADLRASGSRKVFLSLEGVGPEVPELLEQRGFVLAASEAHGMAEFDGPR
jgi:hypothetical protein